MQANSQNLMLPWTDERTENRRFRLILAMLCAFALLLGIWIPWISLPEPEREELERLPPQLARLLVEKPKPALPVAPSVPEPKPEPKPDPEPEPKPEAKPKPKPEPKPVKKKPVASKPNQTKLVKEAREVAKKSGLLALQSELADLRTSLDVSNLSAPGPSQKKASEAARANALNEQAVLSRSQGVASASIPAPVSGQALSALSKESLTETEAEKALARAEAEAALGERERSEESIRLGIEKLKKSFYTLYNRELRKDPFLEGTLVLEIVFEPSGQVSACRVVSSELNHKALESKIVSRMKLANFGAENVSRTTRTIPFNFQPK